MVAGDPALVIAGERGRDGAMRTLETSLQRRFRVVDTPLDVGGRALSVLHPASAEDLISESDFEHDERLPYWAELWPSSRVLAAEVLGMDGRGRTALELGCGAGLVATCAAAAGFEVCASDYYEDALRFTRLNVWRNCGSRIATRLVDWRDLPHDLGQFDVVIASDVLYELSYGPVVARALVATLKRGGSAVIADPGRVARTGFIAEITALGLVVVSQEAVPFVDGAVRQTIALLRIGHA